MATAEVAPIAEPVTSIPAETAPAAEPVEKPEKVVKEKKPKVPKEKKPKVAKAPAAHPTYMQVYKIPDLMCVISIDYLTLIGLCWRWKYLSSGRLMGYFYCR